MRLPQEILVLDELVEQISEHLPKKDEVIINDMTRLADTKPFKDAVALVAAAKDTPCSVMDSRERVSLRIGGMLHGFIQEGETEEKARGRMLLEAETCINEHYHLRAHIGVGGVAYTEKGSRLLEGRKDWHIVDVNGKIPPDEPVVTFRARDPHMIAVLKYYGGLLIDNHCDAGCILAIANQRERTIDWQAKHRTRATDVPMDMVCELTDEPVEDPDMDPVAE